MATLPDSNHTSQSKSRPEKSKRKKRNFPIHRISLKKTFQLVQEFYKEECLWNTNLPDYPHKQKRLIAYGTIAAKLDIPNFKACHVMDKLKNLRNSYCQELKKIASNENYKPRVLWFATMHSFLQPHLQKVNRHKDKSKALKKALEVKVEIDSDDQLETTDWVVGYPTDDKGSHFLNSIQRASVSEERSSTSKTKERKYAIESTKEDHVQVKSEYREVEPSLNQSQLTVDPLQGITATILEIDEELETAAKEIASSSKSREVDHHDAFGTYVASLLRSLPPKKALMLQTKIVKMIVSVGVEEHSDEEVTT